jgi:hypothetical protein
LVFDPLVACRFLEVLVQVVRVSARELVAGRLPVDRVDGVRGHHGPAVVVERAACGRVVGDRTVRGVDRRDQAVHASDPRVEGDRRIGSRGAGTDECGGGSECADDDEYCKKAFHRGSFSSSWGWWDLPEEKDPGAAENLQTFLRV